jgi:hypothetical protein
MGTATDCGYSQAVKHLLYDGGDYKLWGYITRPAQPAGSMHLKIASTWANAKDPEGEQNQLDMMLDQNTINNFKRMFESL